MPLTKKQMKIDPMAIYICWTSFATEINGQVFEVQQGQRLRGDHPAVKHYAELGFVPDGTLPSEMPHRLDRAIDLLDTQAAEDAEAAALDAAPPVDPETRLADLRICKVAVTASKYGSLRVGAIVAASHPLVREAPEAFAPLTDAVSPTPSS